MTNREVLNNMSNEELAHFIITELLTIGRTFNDSITGIGLWLEEEYEEYDCWCDQVE